MKQFGLFLVLLLILPFILILSCETVPTTSELEFLLDLLEVDEMISLAPPPPPPPPPPEPAAPPEEPPTEELPSEELLLADNDFDPDNVSEELYETTKTEIQNIIQTLDNIIRARNYNAWLGYLSNAYREEVSSPEFLEERTDELYRRDQIIAAALGRNPGTVEKKVLRNPRDYFDNVVVPSRANDRVDDITFITETKIRAYTVNNRGTRLILYDLEKIDNTWKIIG